MKYHRLRDTRKEGGIRMSCSITADSASEADAIFEKRWAARHDESLNVPAPTLPEITNASLREQFMAPGALEIKRRTPALQYATPQLSTQRVRRTIERRINARPGP